MNIKFQIVKLKNSTYQCNLLSKNNYILFQSVPYTNKKDVTQAVRLIKSYGKSEKNYFTLYDKLGNPYFVIKGLKNENLGTSQMYETLGSARVGILNLVNALKAPEIETENVLNIKPTTVVYIKSVNTFLQQLDEMIDIDEDYEYFYRGHHDISYELIPSIYRNEGLIEHESEIFKELIIRCPSEFNGLATTFQTLVKMQHYSLPTRLLDLTSNPLIALYFACGSDLLNESDGEVIIFKILKSKIKYFDSDTVSVISNISKRSSTFKIPEYKNALPKISIEELERFNKESEIKFLLHEIKNEKPYFESNIQPSHLESVVCVKPMLDNQRAVKQDGAFFLFGIDKEKKRPAKINNQMIITKEKPLIIKLQNKAAIREQLKRLGISQGTIFPDIDNVAKHIKDQFSK